MGEINIANFNWGAQRFRKKDEGAGLDFKYDYERLNKKYRVLPKLKENLSQFMELDEYKIKEILKKYTYLKDYDEPHTNYYFDNTKIPTPSKYPRRFQWEKDLVFAIRAKIIPLKELSPFNSLEKAKIKRIKKQDDEDDFEKEEEYEDDNTLIFRRGGRVIDEIDDEEDYDLPINSLANLQLERKDEMRERVQSALDDIKRKKKKGGRLKNKRVVLRGEFSDDDDIIIE